MPESPREFRSPANGPATVALVRGLPMACLLVALLLMVILAPFLEHSRLGDIAEAVLLTAALLLALPAMGVPRNSGIHAVAVALLIPALVAKWLNQIAPDVLHPAVFLVPAIMFLLLFVCCLLRFILTAPKVDANVICASVTGYLMLALLWSLAYTLTEQIYPNAFAFTAGPASSHAMNGFTPIYFSIITLSTVGYGDIVPILGPSRMLAAIEAICGTFYMAILVARLVAVYSTRARPPAGPGPDKTAAPDE